MITAWYRTPLGSIGVVWNGAAIARVEIDQRWERAGRHPQFPESVHVRVQACLAGEEEGHTLPIAADGTAFQQRVWQAIRAIPRGEVLTYSALADNIGNPRATRAAANACGANPCAILIPCHRVIRRNYGLGGYAWGLDLKIALLATEGFSVTDQGVVLSGKSRSLKAQI